MLGDIGGATAEMGTVALVISLPLIWIFPKARWPVGQWWICFVGGVAVIRDKRGYI